MPEGEMPSRQEAPEVHAPSRAYDLAAEERQKRRQFFVAGPLSLLLGALLGTLIVPLVPIEHVFTVLFATLGFVTTLVPSLVAVWDRLTLRRGLRVLAWALLAAFLMAAWALLAHRFGILPPYSR